MSIKSHILSDGYIDIVLYESRLGDSAKGYVTELKSNIVLHKTGEKIGYINLRLEDTEKVVMYIGHIGYVVDEAFRGKELHQKLAF